MWEFDGSQVGPPFTSYTAAEFITMYQLVWENFSAAGVAAGKPSNWFKFIWNPNGPTEPHWNYLAGPPYVSVIGPDDYDGRWPYNASGSSSDAVQYLNGYQTFTKGGFAASLLSYAKSGPYDIIFPEWGMTNTDPTCAINGVNSVGAVGSGTILDFSPAGDDPAFVQGYFEFCEQAVAQGTNVFLCPWGGSTGNGYGQSTYNTGAWSIPAFPAAGAQLKSSVSAGLASGLVATEAYSG
jgi:hypothetical protein